MSGGGFGAVRRGEAAPRPVAGRDAAGRAARGFAGDDAPAADLAAAGDFVVAGLAARPDLAAGAGLAEAGWGAAFFAGATSRSPSRVASISWRR
ncbi:MAG: hypothetical protein ABSC46_02805 [Candidatus Limnocylindrales bacterium]